VPSTRQIFSVGLKPAVIALLLTPGVLPGASEAASVDCEAILRDAVFDNYRVRNLDSRIEQAKSALCGTTASSQSFTVEVDGGLSVTDREALCTGSEKYLQTNRNAQEIIDRASSLIESTFNECSFKNTGGVSHGIFTTDDPAVFTYQVQFTPDPALEAETSVAVDTFEVHNSTCRPPLAPETDINQGRRTFICTRDPGDSVVIGLNTADNKGTQYLEPILLNPFTRSESAAPVRPVGTIEQAERAEPAVAHSYSRFGARRQLSETSCDNPSFELNFEEKTQVKLFGEAVAQGGSTAYPLWIQIKVDGEIQCERQAWPSRRGSVERECMVWVEANTPMRVEATQVSKGARCTSTTLEVWH